MKLQNTVSSLETSSRYTRGALLGLAVLLLPQIATAAEDASGWDLNFTPVLVLPEGSYRLGGGTDPELKYTYDLGGTHFSLGGRVGGYYAKNLFGVTVMPTLRVAVPLGPVEPYASLGAGYGWLPKVDHEGLATMSRLGVVFHFTDTLAIGVEGTLQKVYGSEFEFPSFGSMMAFNL